MENRAEPHSHRQRDEHNFAYTISRNPAQAGFMRANPHN